jgi:twitching motility protein PilI
VSKLDLRSFQQEIAERLAAARRTGGEAPRLAFFSAGQRLAMPLIEISEVSPLGAVRAVPGSEPWFLGLTNIRGSVLAVSHLGALTAGVAPSLSVNSRVLVLGGEFARLRCGLVVDSVVGLRAIQSIQASSSPSVLSDRVGSDAESGQWNLLDTKRLILQTKFFDVATSHATHPDFENVTA